MPPLITLRDIAHSAPDGRALLNNLNLSFGAERTGLIGRNGIGKTTLLAIICGEIAPQSGSVEIRGSLARLRQEVRPESSKTAADACGVGDSLARIARIVAGRGSVEDAAEADWTLEDRLADALRQVGLERLEMQRPLAALSGGERTRLALARLILDRPDIILLDEPTNNLDRDGRAAVHAFLSAWRGAAIVVSHDRALLGTMDRIVELSDLGAKVFGGGWALYEERKREEVAAAEHMLAVAHRQAKEAARRAQAMAERQARRDAAGRRSAPKAGLGKMALDARVDRAQKTGARAGHLTERKQRETAEAQKAAERQVERKRTLSIPMSPTGLPAARTVLAFENVSGGAGEPPIIDHLSFALTGPERVAVTGPNGSGKTMLLRLATGEIAPAAGNVRRTGRIAMLSQEVGFLKPEISLVENFHRLNPGSDDNACRAALARFLFRRDDALKRAADLSGGEVLRAGLCCVLSSRAPPELLLLDEPTNHLDLDSIAAVEAALNHFDGALLVVSHDETFLANIGIARRIEMGPARR